MESKHDTQSNELFTGIDGNVSGDCKRTSGCEVSLGVVALRHVPPVLHGTDILWTATVVLGTFGLIWQLQDHGLASTKLAMVLAATAVLFIVVVVPFVRNYFTAQKAAIQADFDRGLQRVDQLVNRTMAAFDERLNRIQPALNVAQAFAPAANAAGPAVAAVAGHNGAIYQYGPYIFGVASLLALMFYKHTPAPERGESVMERRSRAMRNALPTLLAAIASYLDDTETKGHFVKRLAEHIKSIETIADALMGSFAQRGEMFQAKVDRRHVHFVQGETLYPDGKTEPAPLAQTDADLLEAAKELHKGFLRVHANRMLSQYHDPLCPEGLTKIGDKLFTYRLAREVYVLMLSCDGFLRFFEESASNAAAGAGYWGLKCEKCGTLGCNGKESISDILWRLGRYEYLMDEKLPKKTLFTEENYKKAAKVATVGLAATAGAFFIADFFKSDKRRCENCKKEHSTTFVTKWGAVMPSRWCDDCVLKTTDEKTPTYAEACGPVLPTDELGMAQHAEAVLDRDGKFTELLQKYKDGNITADEVVSITVHALLPCDYCREVLCDKTHFWPKIKAAFWQAAAANIAGALNGAVAGVYGFSVGVVLAMMAVMNMPSPYGARPMPREYMYRPGMHVFECANLDEQVSEATDDDVKDLAESGKGFKGGRLGFKSNEKYKRRPFSMHKINRHREQHQSFSNKDKRVALKMYTSDPILSGDLVEIGGKRYEAGSNKYHKAIEEIFKQGGGWIRNLNKDRSRTIWVEKYDEEKSKMPFKDSEEDALKREDAANWYAAQRAAQERAHEEGDYRHDYEQKLEMANRQIEWLRHAAEQQAKDENAYREKAEAEIKWLQTLVNTLETNMSESKTEIDLSAGRAPKPPPLPTSPTPAAPAKAEAIVTTKLPDNIAKKANELFQCHACLLRRLNQVNKREYTAKCDQTTGISHKTRLPGSCPGKHRSPFCWFDVCSKLKKAVEEKKKAAVATKAEAMNSAVPVMAVAKAHCYGYILAPFGDRVLKSHAVFVKIGGKPMVRVCWHGVVLAKGIPTLYYGEDLNKPAILQRLSEHPSGAWHEGPSDDAFYPCPEDAVKYCVDIEQPGNIEGKEIHVTLLHFKDLKNANLAPRQQIIPVLHRTTDHSIVAGEGKEAQVLPIRECLTYKPNTWDGFSGAPVFNDKGKVIGYHMSSPGPGPFKDGQVASFAPVNASEHNRAAQAKNVSVPTLQINPPGSGTSSKQKAENERKRA